jgi:excisionase family DNA binding protein
MMENKNDTQPTSNMPNKLLRGRDAAEILNCSSAYVFQLVREGRLPGVYLGRSVRIRNEDIEAFIEGGGWRNSGNIKHAPPK